MVLKNQKWDSVLELFFNNPEEYFTIRRINKETKVPTSTIQRYLRELRIKGIIDEKNKFSYNNYSKFLKTFFMINKMYEAGLIDFLIKELNPSLIVVFGSVRKGEYDKDSDIDIFIETPVKKELSLKEYEKILKHKIDIFLESNIKRVPKSLLNNILNGIKLFGYVK
ncbi:nucleotidyltransferase domain-containing protein [Candidatus Woesearchaeota archaeon]|nr:nucleotidyltransferase domain-containing protein [Candidatus Woesearchaeota archaeon]